MDSTVEMSSPESPNIDVDNRTNPKPTDPQMIRIALERERELLKASEHLSSRGLIYSAKWFVFLLLLFCYVDFAIFLGFPNY